MKKPKQNYETNTTQERHVYFKSVNLSNRGKKLKTDNVTLFSLIHRESNLFKYHTVLYLHDKKNTKTKQKHNAVERLYC